MIFIADYASVDSCVMASEDDGENQDKKFVIFLRIGYSSITQSVSCFRKDSLKERKFLSEGVKS